MNELLNPIHFVLVAFGMISVAIAMSIRRSRPSDASYFELFLVYGGIVLTLIGFVATFNQ